MSRRLPLAQVLLVFLGVVLALWAASVITWTQAWHALIFWFATAVVVDAVVEIRKALRPKPPEATVAELTDALKRLVVEREKAETMLKELKELRIHHQPPGSPDAVQ